MLIFENNFIICGGDTLRQIFFSFIRNASVFILRKNNIFFDTDQIIIKRRSFFGREYDVTYISLKNKNQRLAQVVCAESEVIYLHCKHRFCIHKICWLFDERFAKFYLSSQCSCFFSIENLVIHSSYKIAIRFPCHSHVFLCSPSFSFSLISHQHRPYLEGISCRFSHKVIDEILFYFFFVLLVISIGDVIKLVNFLSICLY